VKYPRPQPLREGTPRLLLHTRALNHILDPLSRQFRHM
jgi:hypothetical protein